MLGFLLGIRDRIKSNNGLRPQRLPVQAIDSNDAAAAALLQSCPTLCGPIGGSPPASPGPGVLQARTLEWVATSFSNA